MGYPSNLVLDLFSGTGSATQPFVECGKHRVVRVDIAGKPDVRADVRHLPLKGPFEFVWASPPCTEYSYARARGLFKWIDPDLSCWRAVPIDGPYVIENVLGARRWWGPSSYHWGPWHLWTNLRLGFMPTGKPERKTRAGGGPNGTWGRGKGNATIPRPLAEAVHRAVCEQSHTIVP